MSRKNKNMKACLPTKWESAELNNWAFNHYFYSLLDIAVNSYNWINLPSEIDPRFLEYCVNVNGYALFSYDDIADAYLVSNASLGGTLNVYSVPNYRRAFAPNGYNQEYNADNSVIIYNNYMRTPTYGSILFYARKLYELERTLDTEIYTARIPAFVTCSESQRLTMENLMMKYDGNVPLIFGNKDIDTSGIKVLDLKPGDKGEKMERLYNMKRKYWYEALTFLGVDSVNEEKKERLVSAEVERGNSIAAMYRYTRLNARKFACQQINQMFGLDIDVEYQNIDISDFDIDENGFQTMGGAAE